MVNNKYIKYEKIELKDGSAISSGTFIKIRHLIA